MRGLIRQAVLISAMAALSACTSENARLDAEVKRLCAIDGGIKVFETVTLPAEKFNEYGQPLVPSGADEKGWGYYTTLTSQNLSGSFDPPMLVKDVSTVIRTSDQKVIATSVVYARVGGGFLEGYMHGSGSHCPANEGSDFLSKVLIQQGKK
jgi:hypothetical protein